MAIKTNWVNGDAWDFVQMTWDINTWYNDAAMDIAIQNLPNMTIDDLWGPNNEARYYAD